jgi:hypothetical protein
MTEKRLSPTRWGTAASSSSEAAPHGVVAVVAFAGLLAVAVAM